MNNNVLSEEERLVFEMIMGEEESEKIENKEDQSGTPDNITLDQVMEQQPEPTEPKLILIEETDVTVSSSYTPTAEDAIGNRIELPLEITGGLQSFVMKSDSQDFYLSLQIDDFNIIDGDFSSIEDDSTELSHISAFTSNGQNIVSADNYPIHNRFGIDISTKTNSEINIDIIRAEIIEGGRGFGGEGPEVTELLEGI